MEVGGGGASCRSSVTRSLFDRGSESEITLLWTNRKPTIRLDLSIAFRPGPKHKMTIENRINMSTGSRHYVDNRVVVAPPSGSAASGGADV